MNRTLRPLCAVLLAAGFFPIPTHAAKLDFTDYAGAYKVSALGTLGTSLIRGSKITFDVTVPKNGRKAKIKILGYGGIASGSSTYFLAMIGNLTLTSSRQVIADNPLLAFYIRVPTTGRLTGSTRHATFTLSGTNFAFGNYSMTYRLTFTGRKLTLVGTGSVNGAAASFTYKGTKTRS